MLDISLSKFIIYQNKIFNREPLSPAVPDLLRPGGLRHRPGPRYARLLRIMIFGHGSTFPLLSYQYLLTVDIVTYTNSYTNTNTKRNSAQ